LGSSALLTRIFFFSRGEHYVFHRINKSSLTAAAAAAIAFGMVAGSAQAAYFQGFETDTAGWTGSPDYGSITRVSSGTNGIVSAAGSWHATINEDDDANGPYTLSGSALSMPFGTGFTTTIDVYIDTAQGAVGEGWAWDVGISNSNATFLEAGGFGAEKTAAGTWSIAPDGDGAGYPGGGLAITTTGWYRLVSEWGDNGGLLTRNSYIRDLSDTTLYTDLLTTTNWTAIASLRNYSWFADVSVPGGLAIDNATSTVPEPTGLALLGLGAGALLLRRRARRA
jgi:hypothetical protein